MTTFERTDESIGTAKSDLYRRIGFRLLPFLFIGYVVAYLDRVNVGFAAVRMQADLAFSAAVYGFGAGIFFIGYVLCEVPSNMLLARIGARKTFTRIMIGWGVLSVATMFVQTPIQFYVVRFFLGAFEAGFFPGVILFLTYWFPNRMCGRILSTFTLAIPISGIFGAPISGYIMSAMDGVNGWQGWQWMFLLEGLPAVILGVLAAFALTDKPADAQWLSAAERKTVINDVGDTSSESKLGILKEILRDPRVYSLGYVYFSVSSGIYVISFWLPSLIKDFGVKDPFEIGMLTAIPYVAGALGMIFVSRHSDLRRERRWHIAGCMILAAAGLVISTFLTSLPLGLAALTFASFGIFGAMPVFWTIPMRYFSSIAAAAGIAFVNTIAQLAGFVSPTVIGWIKTLTNSISMGLYLFSAVLCLGAMLVVITMPPRLLVEPDSFR